MQTYSNDLMLHFTHEVNDCAGEGDAHHIYLTFAGLLFDFRYGNDYLEDGADEEEQSKYYGFYAIDSELFWRGIGIGTHLYDNPLTPMKFIGHYGYDIKKNKLILLDKDYDRGSNPDLTFREQIDTSYTNKNGEIQDVSKMRWFIEERRWTLPLLHWLHLDNLYVKRIVDLEFEANPGIGVNRNEWKGGVCGASICLNDEPKIFKLYNKAIRSKRSKPILDFYDAISDRITEFMWIEKRF